MALYVKNRTKTMVRATDRTAIWLLLYEAPAAPPTRKGRATHGHTIYFMTYYDLYEQILE